MKQETMTSLLQRLDAVPGVSGFEREVGACMAEELAGCYDESWTDALGNRLFVKKGKRPDFTVLLSAHMDEPGFIVGDISPAGAALLLPVGFQDPRLLYGRDYLLYTARGPLPAVSGFGGMPEEKGGQPAQKGEGIWVDLGARSRKGAENMGAAVGDAAASDRRGQPLGKNLFTGRAVDNRAGCAALVGTMQLLRGISIEATVIACASVQGQLGTWGLEAAAHAVSAQAALCFSTCPGAGEEGAGSLRHPLLGGGPAIPVYEGEPAAPGYVTPLRLRQRLTEAARRGRLPWQLAGTDGGKINAAAPALSSLGMLAGGIRIPARFLPSAAGVVDVRDILRASQLAVSFLQGAALPL